MWKMCHKYHLTLLHKEAEQELEEPKKTGSNGTYLVASKLGEEVLLMTCQVKDIASDGSVTQTKALLQCTALTSLITERLIQ